jgi:hypothetical protein
MAAQHRGKGILNCVYLLVFKNLVFKKFLLRLAGWLMHLSVGASSLGIFLSADIATGNAAAIKLGTAFYLPRFDAQRSTQVATMAHIHCRKTSGPHAPLFIIWWLQGLWRREMGRLGRSL